MSYDHYCHGITRENKRCSLFASTGYVDGKYVYTASTVDGLPACAQYHAGKPSIRSYPQTYSSIYQQAQNTYQQYYQHPRTYQPPQTYQPQQTQSQQLTTFSFATPQNTLAQNPSNSSPNISFNPSTDTVQFQGFTTFLNQVATTNKENGLMEEKLKNITEKYNKLEKDLMTARDDYQTLSSEKDDLQMKLNEFRDGQREFNNNVEQVNKQLNELKIREKTLNEREEALDIFKNDLERREEKISLKESSVEDREEIVTLKEKKLDQREKDLNVLEDSLTLRKATLDSIKI